jgi:putative DNA primase/helicase
VGIVIPPPRRVERGRQQQSWTTLGEHYLVEHRKLDKARLSLGHALRWHIGIQALVALMTDPASNEPVGIHRTFLESDGAKRERKMLGRQGVIRLSPDDTVTMGLGLTEGVEDGLAVLLSGWTPVWSATSAGAIERFPVLPGVEALTLFADADATGLKAAQACRDRWLVVGREAVIAQPRRLA